jgi:signal transduction histidine kinase
MGATDGGGLGLAISRGLVEAQGGRIWAESRPGGGARVSFTGLRQP